jgi:hypothetical protein
VAIPSQDYEPTDADLDYDYDTSESEFSLPEEDINDILTEKPNDGKEENSTVFSTKDKSDLKTLKALISLADLRPMGN